MPLFGAPHGYGTSQLDEPPATPAAAWSIAENIRAAVVLVLDNKARVVLRHLRDGFPTPTATVANQVAVTAFAALTQDTQRAMFRREVVRRYNGGSEFTFNGTVFQMTNHNPNLTNRFYPATVLSTRRHVGATTTPPIYPGPTNFTAADFGPGIP
jgi:hypothetical protein